MTIAKAGRLWDAPPDRSARGYQRLAIEVFSRHLLQTGDLDPVYIALNACGWTEAQRLRWLVAYIAFYHCGAACYLSQFVGAAFWDEVRRATVNEAPAPIGARWPRGHERRHFRGRQAMTAVDQWAARWCQPEGMFAYMAAVAPSFADVTARAKEHRSVGDWLSFKIVDLVDACLDGHVDQRDAEYFLYERPRASLVRVWRERFEREPKNEMSAAKEMIAHLQAELRDCTIPHKPGRPIDLFCLETVSCKFASHLSGHYPLYNDIREIRKGLQPCRHSCNEVDQFEAVMPPLPLVE